MRSVILLSALFTSLLPMMAGERITTSPAVATREPVTGLAVALDLPDHVTLPGASVPLMIRIRNGGPASFVVSRTVQVHVTSPAGDRFVATWGWDPTGTGVLETPGNEPVSVLFGQTIWVAIPAVDLAKPSWALDRRMAEPGVWTLQVALFEEGKTNAGPAALSTPAKLTIESPGGPDALTWAAIQQRDWSAALASVFPERRESPYFPYLATWFAHENPLGKAEVIADALARHPGSPVADSLRFSLAYYYAAAGQKAFYRERNVDKAVEYTERARAELLRAKEHGPEWVKARADRKMAELPSRSVWEARLRSHDQANTGH